MNAITLRQLGYLLALREHQSFSRAARQMNVTQSTLSAGIGELELALGQTLIDRSRRQIAFTPLGEDIAADAARIIEQVEQLVRRADKSKGPLNGPLRLGVIPTIAPYFLPRILPALQKNFPRLELRLHEDLTARLVDELRQGRLDAILIAFPYDTHGLKTAPLFHEEFVLARARNMEWKKTGNQIDINDLRNINLLLLEDGHCLRDHAIAACRYIPPRQRKTFSATSLPTLIEMVRHGYGATLLPDMATRELAKDRNIGLLRFKKPAPSREIGLAWQEGSPAAGNIRILAKFIKEL